MSTSARRFRAWSVFVALAVAYSSSQFFRAAPAVIAPDLMQELSLSAEVIGSAAGLFFLAFGLAQLPVGVLLDRFGPRRTMCCFFLVAAAGTVVFSQADSAASLGAGRALQGLGCAAGLMGSMVVLGRWFPPASFATMSGLLMGFGGIGVLMAASPLAVASSAFGWRSSFVAAAVLTAVFAILLFIVVRDAPPEKMAAIGKRKEDLRDIVRGIGAVMRIRELWKVIAMQLTIYPSVMTVAALWAGPYLADVHGLDTEARGEALNLMFLALVVAPILFGPLDRVFNTRKWVVIASVLTLITTLSMLALIERPSLWQVQALFLALGLASPGSLVLHAHARSILPENLVGRGLTLQNMAAMGGIFVLQAVSGLIVGSFASAAGTVPETAYRTVFGFLAACMLLSLMVYMRARDVKPGQTASAERAA
jgi:sugar phosphate permease